MDALWFLALLVCILLIIYQFTSNKRNQHKNLPLSPHSLPIIGHLHLLKMPLCHEALENLSNKYGPILFLRLGSLPTLVLSSYSAIKECFLRNDIIFSNRPLLPSRKALEINNNNIGGAPYGNEWHNIRRFSITEIFSVRSLQMSSEIRIEEIRFMMKHLYKSCLKGVKKVELKSFFFYLSYNIVLRMVAGKRYFEDEEMDLEITKRKLYDLLEMFSPRTMAMTLGDYFPFLRWLTYYGEERRLHKLRKRSDAFIQALLDAHQNNSVYGLKTSQSIIDVMLKLQETEPEFYTNSTIKGIIEVMFVAGVNSTANTNEWVVSQLMSHPDVFQKARDEIDNHVGNLRLINDADLAKLPYLHCIINETLRLSGGALLPARECSEDCIVGGYHIPQGTQLLVNAKAMHRDPELWPEPNKFKPERFLQSEEEKVKIKFIAFGIGRRRCPGEAMAMRVMALTIGTMIQCFDWEDARNESPSPVKTNLNNLEKKAFEIVFRPRKALSNVLAQL